MAELIWTPEQEAALALDGHGKLVLAGAGSGKTTVLAERYVRLLAPDVEGGALEPSQIIAMTFSRKAAVNLQAKIQAALLERQQKDRGHADHWHRQRERMPWARIGTIHSICGAMLGAFPLEAGVDPGYTVGERVEERSERAERRLRNLVWARDENLAALLALTGKLDPVRSLVETLLGRPDLVEAVRKAVENPEAASAELDEALVRGLAGFGVEREPEPKRHRALVDALVHLLAVAEPLLPDPNEPVASMAFDDLEFYALKLLQGGSEAASAIKESIHHLLVDEFQDTSTRQWALIQEMVRGEGGEVDHSRLFLVGDDKQSIYGFRSADVTVLQAAWASFAATGDPEANWLVELLDNYRTQAGLLAPLNEAFSRMLPRAGETSRPFEAAARPLNAQRVDHPKAPPMLEVAIGFEVPVEEVFRQIAQRLSSEVGRVVIPDPSDREGKRTRPLQHEDIGVLFRTRTQMGLFETALRNAGLPYRVVRGRGFLDKQEVLDLYNLLAALSDPRDEISLLGVLRSPLLGFSDAAVAALKLDSGDLWRAWGRFANGEVGESEWWQALGAEDREAIERGWNLWRRWKRLAEHRGVVEMLLDALQASGALAAYATGPRGTQRVANLYRVIELVREFSVDGAFTLRRLTERLQRELEAPDEGSEKEAEVDARSGITLMTIHAAKGLEFPCVILPNLESGQKTSGMSNLQRGHLTLGGLESLPLADPAFGVLAEAVEGKEGDLLHHAMKSHFAPAEAAAERLRLVYVAATRARDRLLLAASVKTKTTQKRGKEVVLPETSHLHQWVNALGVKLSPDGVDSDELIDGVELTLLTFGGGDEKRGKAGKDQLNKQDLPSVLLCTPPAPSRWTLPFTAFAEWLANPTPEATMDLVWYSGETEEAEDRDAESQTGQAERGEALWLGDAIHRLYQRFGPGAAWPVVADGFEEMLERSGVANGERDRLRERAKTLIAGGEMSAGLTIPAEAKRELPLRLKLGNLTLRGQADLAWRDGDRAQVLDYKTNALLDPTQAAEAMRSHGYDHQVRLYGLALLKAWGTGRARGRLLFLDGGVLLEEEVGHELETFYRKKAEELQKQWDEIVVEHRKPAQEGQK